jgi:two-component system, sensor histidine kinase and response regulator
MTSPANARENTRTEPSVKLLLVDDHAENLLALEAILDAPGQELVLAQSGAEALRRLLQDDFAAIILDVMMPEMDGFETAAMIRQRERSRYTPIIFLTALGRSEEALFRGYDVGAVDYLMKPVPPALLKSKVDVFVQLKRQSELLEAKNAELHAMMHELEAFSYTVAHDLRAPLARIDGFSQALLEFQHDKLDEEGKRYLHRVSSGTQKMCQLVDDLLMLSKVTRMEIRRERVDLSMLVKSIEQDLRQRDPEREAEFLIEPSVSAVGDAALLRSALSNLLDNAWKFTNKHPRARIEFGQVERDGETAYYVRDDGAGFDQAASERMFQAFQRLHASSEFSGSGVGLATVDRIVKRHGGRMWAEGEVERGATFYFTLTPVRRSGNRGTADGPVA